MGLKRDFIERWMHAERLKKLVRPVAKRDAASAPSPAPVPSPARQATPVPESLAPAREASGSAGTFETHSAPPALVPFADMDFWWLSADMIWTLPGGEKAIPVPRGFVTDFASVPEYFWAWMPPIGRYGLPAIVHDWLYWDQTLLRHQADDIFESALVDLGVARWRRFVLYRVVRWFGGRYWRENSTAKERGEGRVLKLFPDDARITWGQWRVKPGVFR